MEEKVHWRQTGGIRSRSGLGRSCCHILLPCPDWQERRDWPGEALALKRDEAAWEKQQEQTRIRDANDVIPACLASSSDCLAGGVHVG